MCERGGVMLDDTTVKTPTTFMGVPASRDLSGSRAAVLGSASRNLQL